MNIIKTNIDGVLIIEPRLFRDSRGYFFESFSEREFEEKVAPILGHSVHFCQDNESMSSYGVMRGLHFQRPPYTQSKLVRCVKRQSPRCSSRYPQGLTNLWQSCGSRTDRRQSSPVLHPKKALPMVSPFSQKQQSSNTSVITSIIQRQMEVSRFSMKPSVLIGRYLQSMPISLRKTQNMLC